ncbi:cytosolic Fe-S cluster assembly factor NARFL [Clonorchis sinensis]|uniref:Cytosolic Fe-S cluster assembly factor NARFL n=1 Tax=Clonorchis sinensis TaxID=79923 RepID=H2KV12_CLOSI|nr:cytosolic Fe-S cluster assembly factor NARFL [Clonorchis sinensis]
MSFSTIVKLNDIDDYIAPAKASSSKRTIVVSISPQSIVSLASYLNKNDAGRYEEWKAKLPVDLECLPEAECIERFLVQQFRAMGVSLVLNTTWFRDIALSESAAEFIRRFKAADAEPTGAHLPVFCGACPGWICYAEKTHSGGETSVETTKFVNQSFSILPHLSVVRSPQQIAGSLLKQRSESRQSSLYHVTIMPCFDKKLEASRVEFASPAHSARHDDPEMVPDVDLVLATNELLEILDTIGDEGLRSMKGPVDVDCDLWQILKGSVNEAVHSHMPEPTPLRTPMYRHAGSGSGGYAVSVFAQAAEELFSIHLPAEDPTSDDRVLTRTLQNQDLQELLLFASSQDCATAKHMLSNLPSSRTPYRSLKSVKPPACLLAFAVANGFRNIQNLVQSLKNVYKARQCMENQPTRSTCYPFDYVEVMACPGGCINGGGQLKGTFEQALTLYHELPSMQPMSTWIARQIGAYVDHTDPEHHSLHTQYREVPKIEIINPSALQW